MGSVVGAHLVFTVASAAGAETQTCHRLGTAYQDDVDATAEALRTYQQCISAERNLGGCLQDFLAFRAAQEGLQAAFSSYAKACADRLT